MNPALCRRIALVACLSLLAFAGCADDTSDPTGIEIPLPGDEDPGEDPGEDPTDDPDNQDPTATWPKNLLEDTELTTSIFGWPATDFGRGNAATIQIAMHRGDAAIDFTLRDMQGNPHTLATMLTERPVVMILGSFT